jgi:hypothetical protein
MSQSPPLPPPAAIPPAAPACPPKPGYVQAISIMCLVDGCLNIIWAALLFLEIVIFGASFGVATFGVCCLPAMCLMVLPVYPLVVGIFDILYAVKVLPDPIKPVTVARYLAVMQIVNIVSFQVFSVVTGIICLVFYNDPKVKEYFEAMQPKPPAQA